jgi:hypothetical protein
MKHYVYKITFPGMPWFYYGVHTENGRDYWGSPKTHKWIWDFYDYKKQILQFFSTREEADLIEKRIIDYFLGDKNCLNECSGGKFSLESLRKGALKRNSFPIKESTREKHRLNMKRRWSNPKTSEKLRKTCLKNLSKFQEPEVKEKRSNSAKTTFKAIGHQKGNKNSQFGTMWITNGEKNLKIQKNQNIPKGYYPGRILKSRV